GLTGQAAVPERTLFSQYSGNPDVGDIRRAAITTRYKYVYDPRDQAELYDLLDDPLEMHNLAPDPEMKPIVRDLHEQTRRWHGERGDWVGYNNE
ncbi:DUF4976 domain-containing protein, partial [bacterium]|nr:DUF4976 domain-containing protein [bacterium]